MAGREVHLLVLVHGWLGNPSHLDDVKEIIEVARPTDSSLKLEVLVPKTNSRFYSMDGIEWGAKRIAEEVLAECDHVTMTGGRVVRFSIAGYGMGGLVARYLIGYLWRTKFFFRLKHNGAKQWKIIPTNFATFATPHLGLSNTGSFYTRCKAAVLPRICGRSEKQLYCKDQYYGDIDGRPLLEVMIDKNTPYYRALAAFETRKIYANAVHDFTVPYYTAMITKEDPFSNKTLTPHNVVYRPDYYPLIDTQKSEERPHPRVLSRDWFRRLIHKDFGYIFYLPSPFNFVFPLNILFLLIAPIVIPVAFLVAILLSLSCTPFSTRRTKSRMLYWQELDESDRVLARMEEGVSTGTETPSTEPPSEKVEQPEASLPSKPISKSSDPRLTRAQEMMADSLNALHLDKHVAFIDPVWSSHGAIISREGWLLRREQVGRGVLQHWADGFDFGNASTERRVVFRKGVPLLTDAETESESAYTSDEARLSRTVVMHMARSASEENVQEGTEDSTANESNANKNSILVHVATQTEVKSDVDDDEDGVSEPQIVSSSDDGKEAPASQEKSKHISTGTMTDTEIETKPEVVDPRTEESDIADESSVHIEDARDELAEKSKANDNVKSADAPTAVNEHDDTGLKYENKLDDDTDKKTFEINQSVEHENVSMVDKESKGAATN